LVNHPTELHQLLPKTHMKNTKTNHSVWIAM